MPSVWGASLCFGQTETLLCEAQKHPAGLIRTTKCTIMKTIKNRNTSGRPAKKTDEKKNYKMTVKMASDEYDSLKAKAHEAGINQSEYTRQCIQASIVKQRITPELMNHIRQLSGMANNINQIAHKANAAGYLSVHKHCLFLNGKLDDVISKIENDC
jgi:predicted DNA binding CopG/RHH family protein